MLKPAPSQYLQQVELKRDQVEMFGWLFLAGCKFSQLRHRLSPMRQMSLLVRMHDLVTEFSQFIIATHSPILMAYPDAWIYQFDDQGIQRVEYQETDHYQITSRFLRNPEAMLRRLLKSEDELDLGA